MLTSKKLLVRKDFGVVATRDLGRKKQSRSVGKKVLGDSSSERDLRTADVRNSTPSSKTES
ncbi:hypothetical protein Gotur_031873 [Gossypium turneri]